MSYEHTPAVATEAKFYVYVHVKADDGEPFYVGKGKGRRAWNTVKRSVWWKRVVAKHGLVVKIQKHFQDESEAFASEIETIAILRDLGYELCNLTDGGEGVSGFKHSAEVKAKITERSQHYWADPGARQAQAARARRQMASTEARAIMAEHTRKRLASPEARAILAERTRQQMACPEVRAAQAERTRQRMACPEVRAAQAERARQQMLGESSPSAKLSDEVCRKVFLLRAEGLFQRQIAARVGCDQTQVSNILRGKQRRNIYLEFHPEEQ